MRVLILTMGPGETSQCAAVAKYLLEKKIGVVFGLQRPENKCFVDNLNCKKIIFNKSSDAINILQSEQFDFVVFGNSKLFGADQNFQNNKPKTKSYYVSIDSNWLFNHDGSFPYVKWLDRIYINMPETVFQNGLVNNQGYYNISQDVLEKIKTVGLIPSYPPLTETEKQEIRLSLGLNKQQKLITVYIGSGVTFRQDFYPKLVEVVDSICKIDENIKVIYLSGDEPKKPWIITTGGQVDSDTFYRYIAASDLVFQHQGLGTLEQAISTQVPVIANVAQIDLTKRHNHAWEIEPFARAGLCKMHYFSDNTKDITDSIIELLSEEGKILMAEAQKQVYSIGEENLINDVLREL